MCWAWHAGASWLWKGGEGGGESELDVRTSGEEEDQEDVVVVLVDELEEEEEEIAVGSRWRISKPGRKHV